MGSRSVDVRAAGNRALLLEVDDPAGWFDLLWQARAQGLLAAEEIVPGATTVLLDGVPDPAAAAAVVAQLRPVPSGAQAGGPAVEIPVVFDGPDLADVARLWDTTDDGVADRILHTGFVVAFCGFAPGWAYLTGLPAELEVPRLATPRPRVPAGSVALGGRYAGIYPSASPGGWRLVGRTGVVLFDPAREPPALLTPGTPVRLTGPAP